MSEDKHDAPFELPRVEDMIPDEETIKEHIELKMALRESGDLDEVITKLVKTSIKLTAAFLVAQNLIEDLVEIPKEAAYKRIERATRPLWTYLLAIRANAGVENKTDKADKTDAADALPRHRCGNCEHSNIILQDKECRAICKLTGRTNSTRKAGCDRYQPIKEMVVKKDERRCWMCNSFRENIQIKDEGPAYDCLSVGHYVKYQDKACRAFEPRPGIEVES